MNKARIRTLVADLLGICTVLIFFYTGLTLSQWVPLPGALIGLLLLLGTFFLLGNIPNFILRPWQFLLQHMSLFFVPTLVSVPLYYAQIVDNFWALFGTIVITTVFCMIVAGRLIQPWFTRKTGEMPND